MDAGPGPALGRAARLADVQPLDPESVAAALAGADAVVHLAGPGLRRPLERRRGAGSVRTSRSMRRGRWWRGSARDEEARACSSRRRPSATTGRSTRTTMTSSRAGRGFLAQVRGWEEEALKSNTFGGVFCLYWLSYIYCTHITTSTPFSFSAFKSSQWVVASNAKFSFFASSA